MEPEPIRHLTLPRRWSLIRRCAICGRRTGRFARRLEDADETSSHAAWRVCENCYSAVQRELQRAELRSPARVRIAVGVVAAERRRSPRYSVWDERFWEQLSDHGLDRLLIWLFAIAFAVHAIAFILVAAYIAIVH